MLGTCLQLPYSPPFFAMPLRYSPLEFFMPGVSLSLPELSRLCWSSSVSPDISQPSLTFSSCHWSSSCFAGVAVSLPELLLHRRSSCYFLGASFPWNSLGILHKASPVFPELSYYLLWRCYCIIASQFHSFTPRLCQRSP